MATPSGVPRYLQPEREDRSVAAIPIFGIVAPFAAFLTIRIPFGCSVLNPLDLPWPPIIEIPVRIVCLAVVLMALVLVMSGFTKRGQRIASAIVLASWVVWFPIVIVVVFITVWGDPGVGTCVAR
jgi:hypothetical protein